MSKYGKKNPEKHKKTMKFVYHQTLNLVNSLKNRKSKKKTFQLKQIRLL